MTILARIIAGDTLNFVDQVSAYMATDGWTLKYRLVPQFATPTQAPITLTAATYNVTDYQVQVGPATTGAWIPGIYTWSRWVEKTGARQSLGDGQIEVRPDPAAAAQGYDPRTQAAKALADANTALANFQATNGRIKRYMIAGREMEFESAANILQVINYWKVEVARENAAKAVQDGLPNPRRITLRVDSAR